MKQKIYNFNKKVGKIGEVEYQVSDYFQFYHTGLETIIPDDMLMLTQRFNNVRSEVLAYQFLESENLSDTILAINNDVYLWDSPYDNDMYEESVDMFFEYIKKTHKTTVSSDLEIRFLEIAREHVEIDDNMLRNVIIPKKENLQKISRMLKDHLKGRIVE